MVRTSGTMGEHHAGCSKRPDFSPAQLWGLLHPPALSLPRQPLRPGTRLVPCKAAASEEARRTLRYVEPLSAARMKLADFFSILLEGPSGGANQIKIVGEQLTNIVNAERHHRHAIEPQPPRNHRNGHAQRKGDFRTE